MGRWGPLPCQLGLLVVLAAKLLDNRAAARLMTGTGPTMSCDGGVLDYLPGGSKDNEAVIPYPTACILQYQRMGRILELPGTLALHLKGLPKTGTTWVELFIIDVMERVCNSGIYPGCQFQKWDYSNNHQRIAELVIPGQGGPADRRAAVLRFTVGTKHMLTYNVSCDHLTREAPDANSMEYIDLCLALKHDRIRNLVRSDDKAQRHSPTAEEWRDCFYSLSYSEIDKCIPEYMHPVNYPWNADIAVLHKASELWREGKQVDVKSAQRKYVVTIRDPRDSAVSNAHYVSRLADPNEYIISKGCKEYITALALFYYWQVEVQGKVFPTLDIWYQEAVDNPFQQVERTLQHMGLRAPKELIQQTVEATTADAMREMEEHGELPGANSAGTLHAKTNKATYGTYTEELNTEALELCNSDMQRLLPQHMVKGFSTPIRKAEEEGQQLLPPLPAWDGGGL